MQKIRFVSIVVGAVSMAFYGSFSFAGDMPAGYPVKADFPGSALKTTTVNWGVDRKPGKGGKNYGIDQWAPEDMVIVEWAAQENSCINCEGGRDVKLAFKKKGALEYPAGVHVGTRIDTGKNPVGAGGSYTGVVTYTYVTYKDWKKVYVDKYLDDE